MENTNITKEDQELIDMATAVIQKNFLHGTGGGIPTGYLVSLTDNGKTVFSQRTDYFIWPDRHCHSYF